MVSEVRQTQRQRSSRDSSGNSDFRVSGCREHEKRPMPEIPGIGKLAEKLQRCQFQDPRKTRAGNEYASRGHSRNQRNPSWKSSTSSKEYGTGSDDRQPRPSHRSRSPLGNRPEQQGRKTAQTELPGACWNLVKRKYAVVRRYPDAQAKRRNRHGTEKCQQNLARTRVLQARHDQQGPEEIELFLDAQ